MFSTANQSKIIVSMSYYVVKIYILILHGYIRVIEEQCHCYTT